MNEKIEDSLNLALDLDSEQLSKSQELNAGFNAADNSWDLIVRYKDLEMTRQIPDIVIEELYGSYAIITIQEQYIENLANLDEIIYIEMPNRMFYEVVNNRPTVCVNSIQIPNWYTTSGMLNEQGLFGEKTIIGIADSGIDFTNSVFRNADGTTRILELWDQNTNTVYSQNMINEALRSDNPYEVVSSRDFVGHGTAVASIAAGNFSSNKDVPIGIAPKASLIVVKLGKSSSYNPLTTELMRAIDFIVNRANYYNMPLSLNISQGNNYGSHDGTSLLSTYIDNIADDFVISIQVGAGNEGNKGIHVGGNILSNAKKSHELLVGNFQQSFSFSLWKNYSDEIEIVVESPSGVRTNIFRENSIYKESIDNTDILAIYGMPRPYSQSQEMFVQLIPKQAYVTPGIWKIEIISGEVKDGDYDIWLQGGLGRDVRFLNPTPQITITEPSTTQNVITVGAFDSYSGTIPSFSGQGFTRNKMIKPDVIAPGVNIVAATENNGTEYFTGTSAATPFVTGIAALMMEWGIVKGNDRYLYGEKIKAFLQKGTVSVSGITEYPNPRAGYGLVCAKNSFS